MPEEVTRESVQEYLDGVIEYWRRVRDDPEERLFEAATPRAHLAPIYIDAFQAARSSLLGEVLL